MPCKPKRVNPKLERGKTTKLTIELTPRQLLVLKKLSHQLFLTEDKLIGKALEYYADCISIKDNK